MTASRSLFAIAIAAALCAPAATARQDASKNQDANPPRKVAGTGTDAAKQQRAKDASGQAKAAGADAARVRQAEGDAGSQPEEEEEEARKRPA